MKARFSLGHLVCLGWLMLACSNALAGVDALPMPDALADNAPPELQAQGNSLESQGRALNGEIALHDETYSHVLHGSAKAVQGEAEAKLLEQKAEAYLASLQKFNARAAQLRTTPDPGPHLEFGDPQLVATTAAERELTSSPHLSLENLSKVQSEIADVQAALRRLNQSRKLDADERAEWEEKSGKALQDSYILGSGAMLDVLGANASRKIEAQETEIRRATDLLSGETDSNRRVQLHSAFAAMSDNKRQLEEVKDNIEKAHDAVDGLKALKGLVFEQKEKESKTLAEAAWEVCSKFKILSPEASQAKAIVDASYDILVQSYSLQRIGQLNANADQYLKAVDVLNKRMEILVKIKKAEAGVQN